MFVFFNDFITINGKVSKGDSIKIFVSRYDNTSGTYMLDKAMPAKALMTVRGKERQYSDILGHETLDKLYEHVTALYKEHFYFGDDK